MITYILIVYIKIINQQETTKKLGNMKIPAALLCLEMHHRDVDFKKHNYLDNYIKNIVHCNNVQLSFITSLLITTHRNM